MRNFRRARGLLLLSLLSIPLAPGVAFGAKYFTEVANALGVQPCGTGNSQGCYTNYILVTDLHNDGNLDVLMPNSGGGDQPFIVYKNNGDATFVNDSAAAVGGYVGHMRVVAAADITGDGFIDLYAPTSNGTPDKFWINDGTGKLVDEAATRLPGVSSHSGAVRFADVDDDGDMDLLVGDSVGGGGGPLAHLYINDGTGHFAESAVPLPTTSQGSQPYDFDLLDMDGDFDLDLFIDMHTGKGSLWQNNGGGQFVDVTGNLPAQSGLKYGPGTCDVDGDGDLDIWQDNSGPNYTEQLMINDGTGKFADETSARVTGNPGADDNGVTCIDIDGDGDFDAAVTALGGPERLLINDGTGHFTLEPDSFPPPGDSSLWADFGDLNNDGKLDVATGQGESGSFLDRVYIGTGSAVVDTTAPKHRAVQQVGTVEPTDSPVVHFAVSDNAVTDTGPRLKKAYIKITAPAADEALATFMGGDLFRAVLPPKAGGTTVTYQACSIDRQGNEGCSETLSYTVAGMGPAGSGGGGGAPGTGGSGGAGAGGPSDGGGGAAASGGNGGGGGDFQLDNSCGCAIPGQSTSNALWMVGAAGALGAFLRRNRRSNKR